MSEISPKNGSQGDNGALDSISAWDRQGEPAGFDLRQDSSQAVVQLLDVGPSHSEFLGPGRTESVRSVRSAERGDLLDRQAAEARHCSRDMASTHPWASKPEGRASREARRALRTRDKTLRPTASILADSILRPATRPVPLKGRRACPLAKASAACLLICLLPDAHTGCTFDHRCLPLSAACP